MKKFIYITILLVSCSSFSQKKELRNAQKLMNQSFYSEALDVLSQIEDVIDNSDLKYQTHYHYLLGWALKMDKNFEDSIFNLKKVLELDKSSEYSNESIQRLSEVEVELVNLAIEDNDSKNFNEAAAKLYQAYMIDKNKPSNQNYLYFSAGSLVNAQDYETALSHYINLKDIGYTGVQNQYFVTEVESENEIEVSESEYNILKSSKEYKNQRTQKSESRLPEIVKNIALIYVQLGENDKAISAIQDARKVNPDDVNLILNEADLYIRLGDRNKFKELMEQAIEKDPNNAILYYNLGVISGEQGMTDQAISYYKKALEINPQYSATYLNLVGIILEGEASLVEQMNELATSTKRSDFEKYDKLKEEREALYASCLPYLEKLIEIEPKNLEALKTAKNIYYTIGNNEKFKIMSAKIDDLED
tara:strand:- start:237 stop:1493 length:1257 start_codon:yes stop_codon:yes gene_type:complete